MPVNIDVNSGRPSDSGKDPTGYIPVALDTWKQKDGPKLLIYGAPGGI